MAAEWIAGALAAWLLTYALHSTVLLGMAWIAGRIPRLGACSSSLREGMWKLALSGGLVTATLQLASGIDPWSIRMTLSAPAAQAAPVARPAALEVAHTAPTLRPSLPTFAASPAPLTQELEARPLELAAPVESRPAPATPWSWIQIGLAVWLAGVALGIGVFAWQWHALQRRLRGKLPISAGPVHARFEELRERCGVREHVALSWAPGLEGPLTLGILRSEICLPPRALESLQDDELDALFAHEFAHAQRRDPLWLAFCRGLEIVFFFQPLNRIARRRLQDEAEFLCDDWAVLRTGERLPLASCLTEVASWMVHERRELFAAGMVDRPCRLSQRVRRLLDENHSPEPLRGRRWLASGACAAGAAVVFLVPGVSARGTAPGELAGSDQSALLVPNESPARWVHEFVAELPDPEAPEAAEDETPAPCVEAESPAPPAADGAPPQPALRERYAAAPAPAPAALDPLDAPEPFDPVDALDGELDALEGLYDQLIAELEQRAVPPSIDQRVMRLALRLEQLRAEQTRLEQLAHASSSSHTTRPRSGR